MKPVCPAKPRSFPCLWPSATARASSGATSVSTREKPAATSRLIASSKAARRGRDEDAGLTVVRRDPADARPRSKVPVIAVVPEPGEVPVHDARCVAPGEVGLGFGEPAHRRAESVGADHHQGGDAAESAVELLQPDTGDAAVRAPYELGDAQPVRDLGARGPGRVDEGAVEQVASRREQARDAPARLDRDPHLALGVVERAGAHDRSARPLERPQHTPLVELHDRTPHQGVRRQRVGSVPATIHDQDPQAPASEQESRRGSGAARADDDRVVAVSREGRTCAHRLGLRRPRGRQAHARRCGRRARPRRRRRRR